ncbi:MAG: hypothetical protein UW04_C0055G0009 [Parcubacteria group bacterium GW2011_GWB1_43_8]|nr:MAG: hypothetical protein UW04_C0055G0009 [Parcubacteria group bacterium GW2011_GWB1_43_8]
MSIFIKRTWKMLKNSKSQSISGLIRDIFLAMSGIFVVLEGYGLINIDRFVASHSYLFLLVVLFVGVCAVFTYHSHLKT